MLPGPAVDSTAASGVLAFADRWNDASTWSKSTWDCKPLGPRLPNTDTRDAGAIRNCSRILAISCNACSSKAARYLSAYLQCTVGYESAKSADCWNAHCICDKKAEPISLTPQICARRSVRDISRERDGKITLYTCDNSTAACPMKLRLVGCRLLL